MYRSTSAVASIGFRHGTCKLTVLRFTSLGSLHKVEIWRVTINTFLIRRLRFFDLADNAVLIHHLKLADLLHVCTNARMMVVITSRPLQVPMDPVISIVLRL